MILPGTGFFKGTLLDYALIFAAVGCAAASVALVF